MKFNLKPCPSKGCASFRPSSLDGLSQSRRPSLRVLFHPMNQQMWNRNGIIASLHGWSSSEKWLCRRTATAGNDTACDVPV
jgi:hypothetical protein